jgi:hypothetical protein
MKYDNGKIYKIVDNTNEYPPYFGSTIQPLYKRKSQHKELRNKCMSKLIIASGDYDIILVENYPCKSKEELLMRERHYIDNYDCINKTTPGKTSAEWYQDNKEQCKARNREYKRNNEIGVKDKRRKFMTDRREYQASWGGRIDLANNNLLKIDINLFL